MDTIKYYVLYNSVRGGYFCDKGVKSIWDLDVLKADKFMTFDSAKEAKRWFPKNEVEIKTVTLDIR